MSQQSVRQSARRSALDAQAVLRKQRADRERRLEGLAVAVLTALGERDARGPRHGKARRAALQTMTEDEGLSVREAVEWCGSGALRCGRSPGCANLRTTRGVAMADTRACIDRLGHSLSHRAATLSATAHRDGEMASTGPRRRVQLKA